MAKILVLRSIPLTRLRQRKAAVLSHLTVPIAAVRASYVRQYLTCGKPNCRCRRGHKHGPFHYLVQCLGPGRIQKFLLKTVRAQEQAQAAVKAHAEFVEKLEELSRINAELLRRGNL